MSILDMFLRSTGEFGGPIKMKILWPQKDSIENQVMKKYTVFSNLPLSRGCCWRLLEYRRPTSRKPAVSRSRASSLHLTAASLPFRMILLFLLLIQLLRFQ